MHRRKLTNPKGTNKAYANLSYSHNPHSSHYPMQWDRATTDRQLSELRACKPQNPRSRKPHNPSQATQAQATNHNPTQPTPALSTLCAVKATTPRPEAPNTPTQPLEPQATYRRPQPHPSHSPTLQAGARWEDRTHRLKAEPESPSTRQATRLAETGSLARKSMIRLQPIPKTD